MEEEKRKDNTSKLTETVKEDHKSGIMVIECEEGRDALALCREYSLGTSVKVNEKGTKCKL